VIVPANPHFSVTAFVDIHVVFSSPDASSGTAKNTCLLARGCRKAAIQSP
jgi:hypothetical protein